MAQNSGKFELDLAKLKNEEFLYFLKISENLGKNDIKQ